MPLLRKEINADNTAVWDNTIHNYKLTDTAADEEADEYNQYLFNVRRTFDWEGKYKSTVVDIKSKLLKEALTTVMDGVKGVSLVEDTPTVDPSESISLPATFISRLQYCQPLFSVYVYAI